MEVDDIEEMIKHKAPWIRPSWTDFSDAEQRQMTMLPRKECTLLISGRLISTRLVRHGRFSVPWLD
jgi:hypothetical protein